LALGANAVKASAEPSSVSDLSITAVSSPAATNQLYPGGAGDVIAVVVNPNSFEVAISALQLPSATTFATGYTDPGLTRVKPDCDSSDSQVGWRFAEPGSGVSHPLNSPLAVAAGSSLTVVFSDGAVMAQSAPAVCEATYFKMPSLIGITASASSLPVTSGTAIDGWTAATGPSSTITPKVPVTTPVTTRPSSPTTTAVVAPHHLSGVNPTKVFWQPPPTIPAIPNPTPAATPRPTLTFPSPPGVIQKVIARIRRLVRPVGEVSLFTFAFIPFILLFLLIQRRIDRDDPKLALAPVYSNPAYFTDRRPDV
jgi:hypothetical protein